MILAYDTEFENILLVEVALKGGGKQSMLESPKMVTSYNTDFGLSIQWLEDLYLYAWNNLRGGVSNGKVFMYCFVKDIQKMEFQLY